ncbi:MAG: hypothetical protein HOQ05_11135 [Corynebacteriales bacterium]|nr:hypothetical protein [Mycobacteriales bacterium]
MNTPSQPHEPDADAVSLPDASIADSPGPSAQPVENPKDFAAPVAPVQPLPTPPVPMVTALPAAQPEPAAFVDPELDPLAAIGAVEPALDELAADRDVSGQESAPLIDGSAPENDADQISGPEEQPRIDGEPTPAGSPRDSAPDASVDSSGVGEPPRFGGPDAPATPEEPEIGVDRHVMLPLPEEMGASISAMRWRETMGGNPRAATQAWEEAKPGLLEHAADNPSLQAMIEQMDSVVTEGGPAFDETIGAIVGHLAKMAIKDDGTGVREVAAELERLADDRQIGAMIYDSRRVLERARAITSGAALASLDPLLERIEADGPQFRADTALPAVAASEEHSKILEHMISGLRAVRADATPDNAEEIRELLVHLGNVKTAVQGVAGEAIQLWQSQETTPSEAPDTESSGAAAIPLAQATRAAKEMLVRSLSDDEAPDLSTIELPHPQQRAAKEWEAAVMGLGPSELDVPDEPVPVTPTVNEPETPGEITDQGPENLDMPTSPILPGGHPEVYPDGTVIRSQIPIILLTRPDPNQLGTLQVPFGTGPEVPPTALVVEDSIERYADPDLAYGRLFEVVSDRSILIHEQQRLALGVYLADDGDPLADPDINGTPVRTAYVEGPDGELQEVEPNIELANVYQRAGQALAELALQIEEKTGSADAADEFPELVSAYARQMLDTTRETVALASGQARAELLDEAGQAHRMYRNGQIDFNELVLNKPLLEMRLDQQLADAAALAAQEGENLHHEFATLMHTIRDEATSFVQQAGRKPGEEHYPLDSARSPFMSLTTASSAVLKVINDSVELDADQIGEIQESISVLRGVHNPYREMDTERAIAEVGQKVIPTPMPGPEDGRAPRIGQPFVPPIEAPVINIKLTHLDVSTEARQERLHQAERQSGVFVRRHSSQDSGETDQEAEEVYAPEQDTYIDLAAAPPEIIQQVGDGLRRYEQELAFTTGPEGADVVHDQVSQFASSMQEATREALSKVDAVTEDQEGARLALLELIDVQRKGKEAALNTDAATAVLYQAVIDLKQGYREIERAEPGLAGRRVVGATIAAGAATEHLPRYLRNLAERVKARAEDPAPLSSTEAMRLAASVQEGHHAMRICDEVLSSGAQPAFQESIAYLAGLELHVTTKATRPESLDPRELDRGAQALIRAHERMPQQLLAETAELSEIVNHYLPPPDIGGPDTKEPPSGPGHNPNAPKPPAGDENVETTGQTQTPGPATPDSDESPDVEGSWRPRSERVATPTLDSFTAKPQMSTSPQPSRQPRHSLPPNAQLTSPLRPHKRGGPNV